MTKDCSLWHAFTTPRAEIATRDCYHLSVLLHVRAVLYTGVAAVMVVSVVAMRDSQRQREAYGAPMLKGDIKWTLAKTLTTKFLTIIVGTPLSRPRQLPPSSP